MMLMAYLSYMLAEVRILYEYTELRLLIHTFPVTIFVLLCGYSLQLLDLSGILTVFFCGIVMSHYTWHNVTESSRVTTKYVMLQPFVIL